MIAEAITLFLIFGYTSQIACRACGGNAVSSQSSEYLLETLCHLVAGVAEITEEDAAWIDESLDRYIDFDCTAAQDKVVVVASINSYIEYLIKALYINDATYPVLGKEQSGPQHQHRIFWQLLWEADRIFHWFGRNSKGSSDRGKPSDFPPREMIEQYLRIFLSLALAELDSQGVGAASSMDATSGTPTDMRETRENAVRLAILALFSISKIAESRPWLGALPWLGFQIGRTWGFRIWNAWEDPRTRPNTQFRAPSAAPAYGLIGAWWISYSGWKTLIHDRDQRLAQDEFDVAQAACVAWAATYRYVDGVEVDGEKGLLPWLKRDGRQLPEELGSSGELDDIKPISDHLIFSTARGVRYGQNDTSVRYLVTKDSALEQLVLQQQRTGQFDWRAFRAFVSSTWNPNIPSEKTIWNAVSKHFSFISNLHEDRELFLNMDKNSTTFSSMRHACEALSEMPEKPSEPIQANYWGIEINDSGVPDTTKSSWKRDLRMVWQQRLLFGSNGDLLDIAPFAEPRKKLYTTTRNPVGPWDEKNWSGTNQWLYYFSEELLDMCAVEFSSLGLDSLLNARLLYWPVLARAPWDVLFSDTQHGLREGDPAPLLQRIDCIDDYPEKVSRKKKKDTSSPGKPRNPWEQLF